MKVPFREESGFSLTEVIMAVAILSLIAASLLPAFIFSTETSSKARTQIIAANLVQEEAEQVKTLGGSAPTVPYHQLNDYPQFGLERIVTADSPEQGMNTIQINVYKHSENNHAPLSRLTFYLLRDGGI